MKRILHYLALVSALAFGITCFAGEPQKKEQEQNTTPASVAVTKTDANVQTTATQTVAPAIAKNEAAPAVLSGIRYNLAGKQTAEVVFAKAIGQPNHLSVMVRALNDSNVKCHVPSPDEAKEIASLQTNENQKRIIERAQELGFYPAPKDEKTMVEFLTSRTFVIVYDQERPGVVTTQPPATKAPGS
jgi:hypothetical protein